MTSGFILFTAESSGVISWPDGTMLNLSTFSLAASAAALYASAVALEKASLEPMMAMVLGAGVSPTRVLMEVAPVKLIGGMVPKVYLNLFFQMRGDSAEPVIIGILYL